MTKIAINQEHLIHVLTQAAKGFETFEGDAATKEDSYTSITRLTVDAIKAEKPIKAIKTLNIVLVGISGNQLFHSGSTPISTVVDEIVKRGGRLFGFLQKDQTIEEMRQFQNDLLDTMESSHPESLFVYIYSTRPDAQEKGVADIINAVGSTMSERARQVRHHAIDPWQLGEWHSTRLYELIGDWLSAGYQSTNQFTTDRIHNDLNIALQRAAHSVMTAQRVLNDGALPAHQPVQRGYGRGNFPQPESANDLFTQATQVPNPNYQTFGNDQSNRVPGWAKDGWQESFQPGGGKMFGLPNFLHQLNREHSNWLPMVPTSLLDNLPAKVAYWDGVLIVHVLNNAELEKNKALINALMMIFSSATLYPINYDGVELASYSNHALLSLRAAGIDSTGRSNSSQRMEVLIGGDPVNVDLTLQAGVNMVCNVLQMCHWPVWLLSPGEYTEEQMDVVAEKMFEALFCAYKTAPSGSK